MRSGPQGAPWGGSFGEEYEKREKAGRSAPLQGNEPRSRRIGAGQKWRSRCQRLVYQVKMGNFHRREKKALVEEKKALKRTY